MDYDKHIDRIIDVTKTIPTDGTVTVLTGTNGAGKSLVRKLMGAVIADRHGSDKRVASVSMELRTAQRAEWGALSGMARDDAWVPTSMATYSLMKYLLEDEKQCAGKYVVIDEPEIGMGEETVIGLVAYLNEVLSPERLGKLGVLGALVITHNRTIVQRLNYGCFINIDGLATSQEWLDREIVPASLEEIKQSSHELYRAIEKRKETA